MVVERPLDVATADLQCLGHFLPSPFLLSFALVDQHRLRSILPPMSSCGMAERLAPDSELRFAFCWRVGRRVHSFRIQRGRRSRGVPAEGGRPRTSSPQRTRRDDDDDDGQSVRHSSSSALYRIFSARLSRSLALSVRLSVNREVTARPLPSHTYASSLLRPRPGGSRRKCLPSHTRIPR